MISGGIPPVSAHHLTDRRTPHRYLRGSAHAQLGTIGMVLFGEAELDAKVPPFMARTLTREPKTHGAAKGTNDSPVVVAPK